MKEMKIIKVSDEVFEELARIKGDKSFSKIIKELLRMREKKKVEKRVKNVLTSNNEELFGEMH